eukprot:jgi/Ulvmu1/3650/UM017_0064.1
MSRSRQAVWQLSQAVRTLSSSSATASVPAPTSAASGFLGIGSKKAVAPTLDIPLSDYEQVKAAPPATSEPPTSISTLPNGLRVGCQDIQNPLASIAVLVNAGSSFEDAHSEGASQLLESMIFKGTTSRTHFATVRQAENYGVTLSSLSTRESMVFFATAPRDNIAAAAELLFDSVSQPALLPHLLEEQSARISAANNEMLRDPAFLASEGVVSVAYSGSLARPSFWSGAPISADNLTAFHADHVTAANTIVSVAGASDGIAKGLSEEFLGALPTGSKATPAPSMYVGGGSSEHSTAACTAVIAFESPGWSDMQQAMLSTVMGYLLGGGSDFSSGGPGKGMHSRLYRNVLTRNGWINNCTVYNNTFEDTGLFGILMSTPLVARGADLVDILCKELEGVAGGVTQEEVQRAKAACESSVLAALELPSVVSEDIARQMHTYGGRMTIADFRSQLDAIDVGAVKAFAQKLLSSKPSGVLVGDQAVMPKFDQISRRFSP